MRDKFDSVSGEGLKRIVKVDLSGVLELLVKSLVEPGDNGSEVVRDDKEMPFNRVDRILLQEVKEKGVLVVQTSRNCGVWTLMCQIDVRRGVLPFSLVIEVADCLLLDVICWVCQMLGSVSRPHGADFGTSELETNSGKRVGESNGTRIYGAGEMGFLSFSGTAMQQAVSAGAQKFIQATLQEILEKSVPLTVLPYNWILITKLPGCDRIKWSVLPGLLVWKFRWPPLEC